MTVQIQIFFLLGGNETFPMEIQEDFLLTVCTKFSLHKLKFFPLFTEDTKSFSTNAEQTFTHGVYQKSSFKMSLFLTHGGYTKFRQRLKEVFLN